MPVYVYVHEPTGETIERFFTVKQFKTRIRHKGRIWKHSIAATHNRHRDTPRNWPMTTKGWDGVNPSQARGLARYLAERGVPTEVTPDGCLVYTSRAHRKAVHQARGMLDLDAGYGDCCGAND